MLDPFCGSGTSGVEAIRLGRRYIGVDNNPVACLMSEAKLYFPFGPPFLAKLDEIDRRTNAKLMSGASADHPRLDELKSWYHPQTLQELALLLEGILGLKSGSVRDCFLAVFSGVLKNSSSQGKHWGWVCDNVKPKSTEIVYKPALTNFMTAARQFLKSSSSALQEVSANVPQANRELIRSSSNVFNGDSIETMNRLTRGGVDLIMTSPPYFGVADYVKSQRLTYLWFDVDQLAGRRLGFSDFEALRATEAGARSNRSRGDSFDRYIRYMDGFFVAARRVMKPDGHMALVVGESSSRPKTTDDLISVAAARDFKLLLRKEREILPHRRRLMAKVACEEILVFGADA